MGKPCGCGGSGVTVRCSVGLVCAGVGSTNDPLTIQWAIPLDATACGAVMSCVGSKLTSGLIMVGDHLGVRLTPGGGLEFDVNGAVRTTGGGSGGGTGWRSIADLETRGKDVVIGAYGAGYLNKPENFLRSYRYGQHLGLDAMYVPVRFLVDGYPVVHTDESLGRIWGEPWDTGFWSGYQIQQLSGSSLGRIPALAGINDPYFRNQPDGNTNPMLDSNPGVWPGAARYESRSPGWGFFGYNEVPQQGLTFLTDVFREVGGRTPLVLDLRFPARNSGGDFINSTAGWKTQIFMNHVLALIQQFGLTNSVVVTSTEATIPPDNPVDPPNNVLNRFSSAGIRVGPYLETAAQATAHPPDGTWPATWTWVFCNVSTVTKTQVAAYRDKVVSGNPLRTIAFTCNRQHTWNDRVKSQNILGGISGDPVYAVGNAGVDAPHILREPAYRQGGSDWELEEVDHGAFSVATTVNDVQARLRGYREARQDKLWIGPQAIPLAAGTDAFINQGKFAPIPDPTAWSIDLTITMPTLVPAPNRGAAWFSLAICRPNDLPFASWHDASTNLDSRGGYVLYFNQAADVFLSGWDNTTNTIVSMGSNSSGASYDSTNPIRFKIGVNTLGIRARTCNTTTGATTKELFSITTAVAKQHRGKYLQFGRYSYTTAIVWSVAVGNVAITIGAGDGPP